MEYMLVIEAGDFDIPVGTVVTTHKSVDELLKDGTKFLLYGRKIDDEGNARLGILPMEEKTNGN